MTRVVVALFVLGLFSGVAPAAPVPKALKKKPLRAKIEPLPGEKVYTADFDDVPATKVFEWLEKQTELMYISKDVPKHNITLHAAGVCMPELFAQLDDLLYPKRWVLLRKSVSFSTIPVKEMARFSEYFPIVTLDELQRCSQYAPVNLIVKGDAQAGITLADGIKADGFQVNEFGSDSMVVQGRAMDVRKFVAEMDEQIKK